MRGFLKAIVPVKLKSSITAFLKQLLAGSKYANIYFSQSGEDIQIYNILRPDVNKKGVFIDIGAFHPTHLSNTYLLYMNGWRGINIDANPNSMPPFNEKRPADINLSIGVSDKEEELTFYIHQSKAESSFDTSHTIDTKSKDEILQQVVLKTKPINQILQENNISNIDVMSIDAEGFDFKIISSLDFNVYQPKLIVIEQVANAIDEIIGSDVYTFLISKNYKLVARTIVGRDIGSSIYQRQ